MNSQKKEYLFSLEKLQIVILFLKGNAYMYYETYKD